MVNSNYLFTDMDQEEHDERGPYVHLLFGALADLEGLEDPLLPPATWEELDVLRNMTFPQVDLYNIPTCFPLSFCVFGLPLGSGRFQTPIQYQIL